MTIGGVICVKNEERLIERNLRYHLDHAGMDRILVIDNGSYDGTVARVEALEDERITLERASERGMAQDVLTTRGALRLFAEGCDWVVPFDGDEFWVSRDGGSLRRVLEALPDEVDLLVTDGWRYNETVLDDPDEPDPFRRLRYAVVEKLPRILMKRLGDELEFIVIGGHQIKTRGNRDLNTVIAPLETLARVHYRQLSVDDFRARIMNQAEGWLMRYGEEWLRGNGNAERILNWYRWIRDGSFDEKYRKSFRISEGQVRSRLAEGTLHEIGVFADVLAAGREAEAAPARTS